MLDFTQESYSISYIQVIIFDLISGKGNTTVDQEVHHKPTPIVLNHKKDKHTNICLKQPQTKVVFNPH